VQTGAWKSLEELEESLILHEMFLLYRACTNEFSKSLKISAMAQGADVDLEEDWYSPSEFKGKKEQQLGAFDIASMIGLGYAQE